MPAAAVLVAAAASHALARMGGAVVVAIDGRGGAGKSTLAGAVAEIVGAAVVPSDDFFAAEIPASEWDRRSPAERAGDAIDWKRLRQEALEPLLAGKPARWRSFDFRARRPDGSYPASAELTACVPAPVILLDGAYSSRPELADLVSLSVLVEAPAPVREARLRAREEDAFLREWHERWDPAEAHYFEQVRPRSSFDLIVSTAWNPDQSHGTTCLETG
jgi:uridine kinase